MLAIRMQRTGRRGHAMFRVVVQDSRLTPTSGKVVARLGSYDPHAKVTILDKEKAAFYLEHGAQPSDRIARLLKSEGVKLPAWVKMSSDKKRAVRNADKRRSTRPPEPKEEAPAAEAAEPEVSSDASDAAQAPADESADQKPEQKPESEQAAEESSAEESKED